MSALLESVTAALGGVFDPCSLSTGVPLSVIDMGLVTELTVNDVGVVTIGMRPTSAMCTLIAGIMTEVEDTVARVPGVSSVQVSLNNNTLWTEANLPETGRRILESRRQRWRAEVPVRPQEWMAAQTRSPA